MNQQELRELEQLAKATMENNPQDSQDILEKALLERKDEMWQAIQKKARRRVRMRRARPWISAAAMLLVAVLVSGVIGVNQARAGKDGLLVDIVEGVAGRVTFSDEPMEFMPIMLEDGTWDDIMANIDPVLIPLLPEGLPEEYEFESGSIEQISQSTIMMSLIYKNNFSDNIIIINYTCNSDDNEKLTDMGMGEYSSKQWEETDVLCINKNDRINIAWQQDSFIIEIFGLENEEEERILFDAIKKEP